MRNMKTDIESRKRQVKLLERLHKWIQDANKDFPGLTLWILTYLRLTLKDMEDGQA